MAKKGKQTVNGITEGVIWQQILIFFLPILVGAFLQQLYNTADAMVVGRFVGTAALSAVGGTTNTILNLIIGFFIGLSSGATVIISQYFGGGDQEEINRAVHTAIALSLAGGAVLSVLGYIAAPWMLSMLNTPADVLTFAVPYLRIYFIGTIANLLFNVGSGILRAVGDSKGPLYVLAFCTVLNIALDVLFVAVLDLATAGAAIATILSQLCSGMLVLYLVHRKGETFHIHIKKIKLDPELLLHIFRIGLPAGMASVMYSLSNLIIQAGVNGFGTMTIASWTVFGKVDAVFWMIIDSFGIAVTTFIAQNYGARKMARVKKGVKVCIWMAFIMTVTLSALLYFFGGPLGVLFTDDPAVLNRATELMQFMVKYFFTYVFIAVIPSALRAVGDSLVPTIITGIGVCGFRALWMLVIAPMLPWQTLESYVCCYQLSWAITSVVFMIYYKKFAPIQDQIGDITKEEEALA
ncbi:MAG: MATE family efflux transporter [Clostridia bacterium]|nr:MATE family efflux transporter [Clostridia bacterium]